MEEQSATAWTWPGGRLLPASSVPGPAGFPPVKVRASAADLLPSRGLLHQVYTILYNTTIFCQVVYKEGKHLAFD